MKRIFLECSCVGFTLNSRVELICDVTKTMLEGEERRLLCVEYEITHRTHYVSSNKSHSMHQQAAHG